MFLSKFSWLYASQYTCYCILHEKLSTSIFCMLFSGFCGIPGAWTFPRGPSQALWPSYGHLCLRLSRNASIPSLQTMMFQLVLETNMMYMSLPIELAYSSNYCIFLFYFFWRTICWACIKQSKNSHHKTLLFSCSLCIVSPFILYILLPFQLEYPLFSYTCPSHAALILFSFRLKNLQPS